MAGLDAQVVAALLDNSRVLQQEAYITRLEAQMIRRRSRSFRARLLAVRERQDRDAVIALPHAQLVGGASFHDELDRLG